MLTVECPTCKTQVVWVEKNTWRPFCSERCKLIDLGAWADGTYAIPDQPVDPNDITHSDVIANSEDDES